MILPYLATALLVLATIYSALAILRERSKDKMRPTGRVSRLIFPEGAPRAAKRAIGIITLVAAIGLAFWLNLSGPKSPHRSVRFLIPDGYTGWVRIEFEQPGLPPLPAERGQYVARIPLAGTLKTSTQEPFGWANDEYYFYSSDGLRQIPSSAPQSLIWGKINGESADTSGTTKYEEFFVGTEQQFRAQGLNK